MTTLRDLLKQRKAAARQLDAIDAQIQRIENNRDRKRLRPSRALLKKRKSKRGTP